MPALVIRLLMGQVRWWYSSSRTTSCTRSAWSWKSRTAGDTGWCRGAPVDYYEALTEVAPALSGNGAHLIWQGWTEDSDPAVAAEWNRLAHHSIGRAVEMVATQAEQS